MRILSEDTSTLSFIYGEVVEWPVLICVLGRFRLLKCGLPVARHGPKAQVLLTSLALQPDHCLQQDILLNTLWPGREQNLAHQSLNTLIHTIKDQLSDAIDGKSPILFEEGAYRLNLQAGVGVDLTSFQTLAHLGDQQYYSQNYTSALGYYTQASYLYIGEPCLSTIITYVASAEATTATTASAALADSYAAMRYEYIKSSYLILLIRLAECNYFANDYDASLEIAFRLLSNDPHREDAHRVVMRSYVRLGQRVQALHHYELCKHVLQTDLGIEPEPSTAALFNQIRLDPDSVCDLPPVSQPTAVREILAKSAGVN